jgi:hypothetical protein
MMTNVKVTRTSGITFYGSYGIAGLHFTLKVAKP